MARRCTDIDMAYFWLGVVGILDIWIMTMNHPLINIPDMLGNNTLYWHCWAFSIINACVGIFGFICWNLSKFLRLNSPIIYCLVMCIQVMVITELCVWWEHWESISESMWKELDPYTINKIEETFQCCSWNGTDTDYTWAADVAEYANCTATYSWDPIETCWRKLYVALNKRDEDGYNGSYLPYIFSLGIVLATGFFFLCLTLGRKEKLSRNNNAPLNWRETPGSTEELRSRML